MNAVACNSNDALYEELVGVDRVVKDHQRAVMRRSVWQKPKPVTGWREDLFVHQKEVAGKQCVFHAAAWDLRGLHQEGDDKEGDSGEPGHGCRNRTESGGEQRAAAS